MEAYDDFIKERLSALRSKKGVSARSMSLSIGQSENYINIIENGYSLPSMTAFFYICEYLGITPKEFFDDHRCNPKLIKEIDQGNRNVEHISETELLNKMGFTENWKDITRYHLK